MEKDKIYESDNWTVEVDNQKNVIVSYFEKGHYKCELVLDIKDDIKVVRAD
jgi:hypothetical protein